MKTTGIATGVLLGGGLIGGLVGYKTKKSKSGVKVDETAQVELELSTYGQMFFADIEEFQTLSAASKRMFPEYEIGSGVPYFIDNQLVGTYGSNLEESAQECEETGLTRREIFKRGIVKLEEEAVRVFDKRFVELEKEQMDDLLASFQNDEVELLDTSASVFITLLRSATLKGIYSDPTYEGNLIIEGLPGQQTSVLQEVERDKCVKVEQQLVSGI